MLWSVLKSNWLYSLKARGAYQTLMTQMSTKFSSNIKLMKSAYNTSYSPVSIFIVWNKVSKCNLVDCSNPMNQLANNIRVQFGEQAFGS